MEKIKRKAREEKGVSKKDRKRWRGDWWPWDSSRERKSYGQQVTDYRSYRLSFTEWLLYGAQGAGVCALIAYAFYRSLAVFLFLLPVGLAYPLFHKEALKKARLFQLGQQFKEGILILAANLSAGYSIENALENSTRELDMLYGPEGMINREFAGMVKQIRLNRPVELVFFEFADRSGLEDVQNFAQVFKAAKRSGGDLVSIIDHTAGVIRDKVQVREEIANMTASKKLEQKVMNMIPFGLIIYIDSASPGFFGMMYGTAAGRVLMTICLGVYGLAFWLSKRILSIPI